MNKRKIALLAMSACMIAILAIGGTLAYFTDTDQQTNVFTTGNVAIDLYEDFDGDGDGFEKLVPTTGKDELGRQINGVEKEVYVKNLGTEDAFVRVHFAIPNAVDSGRPELDASDNLVHFNMARDSFADGKWSWLPANGTGAGYIGNGEGNWNVYETEIGGIAYNVYVITYRTALKKDEVTLDAVNQVYMEKTATNADITKVIDEIGPQWKIYVAAEACQAEGFDGDAYKALNTTFGDPQAAGYETKVDWTAAAKGETYVDSDSVKGW